MSTARDLLIIALGPGAGSPEPGELSLALAGAELIDLVAAEAVTLDGDLVLPRPPGGTGDGLLDEAAASAVREAPYESVEDWLWRRGLGLAAAYLAALEADGTVVRRRHRLLPLRLGPPTVADTPARRRALDRWTSADPTLTGLASAAGIHDTRPAPADGAPADGAPADGAPATVLAAVTDAVTELAAVRQRRSIEQAAFDNIWRGN